MIKAKTVTVRVDDVTKLEIKNESGWAIVRLRDGAEMAHFQYLPDLANHGRTLFWAADQATREAEKKKPKADKGKS